MRRGSSLCIGEGARCSVLVSNLRPSKEVSERIVNAVPRQRVEDLVAVRQGIITCGGKTYEAIYFTSKTFPGLEVYASKRFTVVKGEGRPDGIWATPLTSEGAPAPTIDDAEREINPSIFQSRERVEDIARVREEGFEVDDDNDPAPENIPVGAPPAVSTDGLYQGQSWGWDGIDKRHQVGGGFEEPSFADGWQTQNKTYLEFFLHLLPLAWLQNVLLVKTNKEMCHQKDNTCPLQFGELLQFIGMRLLMATVQGWTLDEFWNFDPVPKPQEEGPCPYN